MLAIFDNNVQIYNIWALFWIKVSKYLISQSPIWPFYWMKCTKHTQQVSLVSFSFCFNFSLLYLFERVNFDLNLHILNSRQLNLNRRKFQKIPTLVSFQNKLLGEGVLYSLTVNFLWIQYVSIFSLNELETATELPGLYTDKSPGRVP